MNEKDNRITVQLFVCEKCQAPNRLGGFPCWNCGKENNTYFAYQFLINNDYLQQGLIKDFNDKKQ